MQNESIESGFTRSDSAGGSVFVSSGRKAAVEALGLGRFGEAMSFFGGTVVDRNRKRSVVAIEREGTVFYLKRFTIPPVKDALGLLFSFRRPVTHAQREVEVSAALARAGLGAPEVAAWGRESGMGFGRKSFLLTVGLADYDSLKEFLPRAPRDRAWKAGFWASLACAVRKMHDAGIGHPDLYSYHVFARLKGEGPEFAFIDLHRATISRRISLFEAVRDLSGLHLTVPGSLASRTDRLRFVKAYFGGKIGVAGRRLIKKILKRSRRIGARGKFKNFEAHDNGNLNPGT